MYDMNGVINRHIARLMTELEDAGCPVIFREAVKSKLQWLRADVLDKMNELNEGNEINELVSTVSR